MARLALSATITLAVSTTAQNVAPPVPLDAQIGLLNFPVTCQIYGFLNQTFQAIFSATAPVYGGAGEQVYFTDVVGHITIPSSIVGLAGIITVTQASADVSVNIAISNASPGDLVAYDNTINNVSLPSTGNAVIRIPPGNSTLPPIGPVSLVSGSGSSRITLSAVSVNVTLQNKSGDNVFGPIPVTCNKQDVNFIIASLNINGNGGKALAPANGFVPSFPETDILFESGSFRFPYQCSFGSFGTQSLDLVIGGTVPTYLTPGQSWNLSNAEAFLHITPNLLSTIRSSYPTVANIKTSVSSFNVLFSNSDPASVNVAKGNSIVTNSKVASSAKELTIPIPNTGSFFVGGLTAGADGTIAGISVGTAKAQVVLQDKSGKSLYSFSTSCNVPAALELIGLPITSRKPGNYSIIPSF